MQRPFLRTVLTGSIVLPMLLLFATVLFALLLGGLPNGISFQATSNPAFLQILWQGNPWETVRLVLVDKPLFVVERLDPGTGLQLWGLFYYAGTVATYLLVSAFAAWHWTSLLHGSTGQRLLFFAGTVALLIGVTYLRRAECCTSGPGWVLETWLLAKVYTPDLGALDWTLVYRRVEPWLAAVQAGVLVGGMALLYRWYLIGVGR